MTRYSKETYVCDRPKCGAVHERITPSWAAIVKGPPDGWSVSLEDGAEKHYCPLHRVVVSVLDVIGEKGRWTKEK